MTMKTTEERLRGALSAAGDTVTDVPPLVVPARRRTRLPLRVSAAALAVAAVAVGVTNLAAPVSQPGDDVVLAMAAGGAGPWGRAEVSVFLCKRQDPFPSCGGKGITEAEREELRRTLAGRPEVEGVIFEDQQKAWENFRRQNTNDTALIDAIRPEDMPESFRVGIREDADSGAVARAAGEMPGVSNAIDQPCLLRRTSRWEAIKSRLPWSDGPQQCFFPDSPPLGGG
ncbi:permease-like cell division protein FtsX [Streptosporangium sp. NPDC004379]|uniref:permease-like cell division protein FtsX n=1 Tax=Streptosporangium sp. NPDC004379 TaxID=3366189 RepID=UPI00367C6211